MDIKIILACVLIAGGAIGFVLPDRQALDSALAPTPHDASRGVSPAAPKLAVARQPAESGWNEDVVLQRQDDGHFYADVRVDGRSYRMLVDTGASVVALSAADASAMGLQWFPDEVGPVAQGASGPVEGVATTIDRMAVGDHEATGVPAIIITEGAGTSLLGQTFLGTIGKVEIVGDRMILGS